VFEIGKSYLFVNKYSFCKCKICVFKILYEIPDHIQGPYGKIFRTAGQGIYNCPNSMTQSDFVHCRELSEEETLMYRISNEA
jgi:hypothetical protein